MNNCWACGEELKPVVRRYDRQILEDILSEKVVFSAFDIGSEWFCLRCFEPRQTQQ